MSRKTKIRDRLVLAGAVSATFAVVAILAVCCVRAPDSTVFYYLYSSFGLDSQGVILWSILLAATVLIGIGIFRLSRVYRQTSEAASVKLLPGLIGAIVSTALALMVTPAGSFIKVSNPDLEVAGMAWLTLYLFGLIFIGLTASWRLLALTRRRKPLLVLCSPPHCEAVDIVRSQWY
jgi:hypothetical protein